MHKERVMGEPACPSTCKSKLAVLEYGHALHNLSCPHPMQIARLRSMATWANHLVAGRVILMRCSPAPLKGARSHPAPCPPFWHRSAPQAPQSKELVGLQTQPMGVLSW
eukprot:scaffold47869_cov29-Tisochrysis_lutea.AAC.1